MSSTQAANESAQHSVTLRLPATSANLGPGFDALGLAMDFHLHVEAALASEASLVATGRDAAKIQNVEDNLVLTTCREVLEAAGKPVPTLSAHLHNEIPLGMGCGSSAAALVAGVALANEFGGLGWSARGVLAEASRREGHPDNVAACVLGGFVASAIRGGSVDAISLQPAKPWQLLLVMQQASLSTKTARALLPDTYSRADTIANVQNVALLTAAFAQGDEALLRAAMADRMHQPFREAVCPLLPKLLPLAGLGSVLGVALSGAGPAVLLIVQANADRQPVEAAVFEALGISTQNERQDVELLWTSVGGPAQFGASNIPGKM
ncbi:homoserine kinase [Terriglobus aquaticus]|uniref:Homoserine kinase n=1 Tax=Terriglobus aquaticus TaxID=940139 RepID=A0ABW9KJW0_9BACT|nr:homoserine kinase [Terriglobus aquaticus]